MILENLFKDDLGRFKFGIKGDTTGFEGITPSSMVIGINPPPPPGPPRPLVRQPIRQLLCDASSDEGGPAAVVCYPKDDNNAPADYASPTVVEWLKDFDPMAWTDHTSPSFGQLSMYFKNQGT